MEELKSEFSNSGELIINKLTTWLDAIVLQLPNLVLAIIIFFLATIMTGYIKKAVRKIAYRSTDNKTIVNLFSNVVAVLFAILVGLIILTIFNLDGTVNKFLATAGVLGLAVGLALQDPLTNLFSGIIMSVRNMYNIGDIVETNGFYGTIHQISLRSTILITPQGQYITIPNKDVIQNPLANYSLGGKRRLDLNCGVSYGDDLNKVKEVALKAAEQIEGLDTSQKINFYFTEFGDSSINFMLQLWIVFDRQADFNQFRSNAIITLKAAFDKADIDIPFPIRTLNFDVKGGLGLKEIYQNKA